MLTGQRGPVANIGPFFLTDRNRGAAGAKALRAGVEVILTRVACRVVVPSATATRALRAWGLFYGHDRDSRAQIPHSRPAQNPQTTAIYAQPEPLPTAKEARLIAVRPV